MQCAPIFFDIRVFKLFTQLINNNKSVLTNKILDVCLYHIYHTLYYIVEVIFVTIQDTDNIMLKENTSAIKELTVLKLELLINC